TRIKNGVNSNTLVILFRMFSIGNMGLGRGLFYLCTSPQKDEEDIPDFSFPVSLRSDFDTLMETFLKYYALDSAPGLAKLSSDVNGNKSSVMPEAKRHSINVKKFTDLKNSNGVRLPTESYGERHFTESKLQCREDPERSVGNEEKSDSTSDQKRIDDNLKELNEQSSSDVSPEETKNRLRATNTTVKTKNNSISKNNERNSTMNGKNSSDCVNHEASTSGTLSMPKSISDHKFTLGAQHNDGQDPRTSKANSVSSTINISTSPDIYMISSSPEDDDNSTSSIPHTFQNYSHIRNHPIVNDLYMPNTTPYMPFSNGPIMPYFNGPVMPYYNGPVLPFDNNPIMTLGNGPVMPDVNCTCMLNTNGPYLPNANVPYMSNENGLCMANTNDPYIPILNDNYVPNVNGSYMQNINFPHTSSSNTISVSNVNMTRVLNANGSQMLNANGALLPNTNTLVPNANGTRLNANGTSVPNTNGTRVPNANGTHGPNANGTCVPKAKGTHGPNTNGTRVPNTNGTHEPNTNGTHEPNTNGTHEPNTNGTHIPNANGTHTHIPNANGTHVPIAHGIFRSSGCNSLMPNTPGPFMPLPPNRCTCHDCIKLIMNSPYNNNTALTQFPPFVTPSGYHPNFYLTASPNSHPNHPINSRVPFTPAMQVPPFINSYTTLPMSNAPHDNHRGICNICNCSHASSVHMGLNENNSYVNNQMPGNNSFVRPHLSSHSNPGSFRGRDNPWIRPRERCPSALPRVAGGFHRRLPSLRNLPKSSLNNFRFKGKKVLEKYGRVCGYCGTTHSRIWKYDEEGKPFCNTCRYFNVHHRGPPHMSLQNIMQGRNQRGSESEGS
ncbi:S-antigen protein, partial [Armadillidium nasatum]